MAFTNIRDFNSYFDYFNYFDSICTTLTPNQGEITSRGQYHFVEDEGDGPSILYVSAPGYKSADIEVQMQEGRLSITGKPSINQSVGVLVPNEIKLAFSINSSYLVESAELKDGLLAVKLTRTRKTEALKIPVMSS